SFVSAADYPPLSFKSSPKLDSALSASKANEDGCEHIFRQIDRQAFDEQRSIDRAPTDFRTMSKHRCDLERL
ncbi:MAG TPA: hypothetical protein VMT22_14665, partial [Terriglobales bacterium]|nr:hypothetical protein [Terriglobales bacterium]